MIPVSLTLSNFMPFGENVPTLSFAGIHVASICGENGSGKSSIIDAITWALWGKTRAKSDDELIRQGESSMEVKFDFAVGRQTYRVLRKRSKAKTQRSSGQGALELQISDEGHFRPITGDSIGQTEKKIVDILHMDYETFINSAFLRQGHADQFTVSTPAERKAVLTNILGLSEYDRLEIGARQMAVRRASEKAVAENAIREFGVELAQKASYEAELVAVEERLKAIEQGIAECESVLRLMRENRESLRVKQQQTSQIEEQITQASRDLERWVGQIKASQQRVQEFEQVIANQSAIDEQYGKLVELRKKSEDYNQRLRLASALNQRRHLLDMAVQRAGQTVLTEHKVLSARVEELEGKAARTAIIEDQLKEERSGLEETARLEQSVASQKNDHQMALAEIRMLEADKLRSDGVVAMTEEKLDLLKSNPQAKCPLCEQELTGDHLVVIHSKYVQEKLAAVDLSESVSARLRIKKGQLLQLERQIGDAESEVAKTKSAQSVRIGLLESELAGARSASAAVEKERETLSELEEKLSGKDYATVEQEEIRELDQSLISLGYDPGAHEGLRAEIGKLEPVESAKRRLDEALRLVEQSRDSVSKGQQAAGELGAAIVGLRQSRVDLLSELQVLRAATEDLSSAEAHRIDLADSHRRAQEALGRVRERVRRCQQLEVLKKEREGVLSVVATEEALYRELAEAFGKKGVQALLDRDRCTRNRGRGQHSFGENDR